MDEADFRRALCKFVNELCESASFTSDRYSGTYHASGSQRKGKNKNDGRETESETEDDENEDGEEDDDEDDALKPEMPRLKGARYGIELLEEVTRVGRRMVVEQQFPRQLVNTFSNPSLARLGILSRDAAKRYSHMSGKSDEEHDDDDQEGELPEKDEEVVGTGKFETAVQSSSNSDRNSDSNSSLHDMDQNEEEKSESGYEENGKLPSSIPRHPLLNSWVNNLLGKMKLVSYNESDKATHAIFEIDMSHDSASSTSSANKPPLPIRLHYECSRVEYESDVPDDDEDDADFSDFEHKGGSIIHFTLSSSRDDVSMGAKVLLLKLKLDLCNQHAFSSADCRYDLPENEEEWLDLEKEMIGEGDTPVPPPLAKAAKLHSDFKNPMFHRFTTGNDKAGNGSANILGNNVATHSFDNPNEESSAYGIFANAENAEPYHQRFFSTCDECDKSSTMELRIEWAHVYLLVNVLQPLLGPSIHASKVYSPDGRAIVDSQHSWFTFVRGYRLLACLVSFKFQTTTDADIPNLLFLNLMRNILNIPSEVRNEDFDIDSDAEEESLELD